MDEEIREIVDVLETLIDDLSTKPKDKLTNVISSLKGLSEEFDTGDLMKIQDDLEVVSNMGQVDSYARNEIINVLSIIETLI